MPETPTPDEIARWAALADSATPGPWIVKKDEWVLAVDEDGAPAVGQIVVPADAEFIAAAREAVPRLIALVAAQAEQNAELRERAERVEAEYLTRRDDWQSRTRERAERAEAELSALRATDEYQRWARAVTERDGYRDAVARVRAVLDHSAKVSPSAAMTVYAAEIRAALDQPTPREETPT